MNLSTLLLIDDDREFIKAQIAAFGSSYNVVTAEGVHSALQVLQSTEVDCVLVDYFLNDGNGHDIARWVAENIPWCPVLLISARLDKNIAIESFSHRIFDVLEKPYSLQSVVLKLKAALDESKRKKEFFARKSGSHSWSLDRERRVFRSGAEVIMLTSTEVKILDVLIVSTNQVVSRNDLVKAIWGSMSVADNTLDTHLTNLRKKAPFFKTMIKGVRGVGYVFEP